MPLTCTKLYHLVRAVRLFRGPLSPPTCQIFPRATFFTSDKTFFRSPPPRIFFLIFSDFFSNFFSNFFPEFCDFAKKTGRFSKSLRLSWECYCRTHGINAVLMVWKLSKSDEIWPSLCPFKVGVFVCFKNRSDWPGSATVERTASMRFWWCQNY